jgi:hypothetical protein
MSKEVAIRGQGQSTPVGQQPKAVLSRPRHQHMGRCAGHKAGALLASPVTEQDHVLSLQHLAGNDAVSRLLQSSSSSHSAYDGRPMPDESRSRLERAFNADLSGVRIETNSARARNNGALAISHGSTISFAPGAFAPNSAAGFYLLAHETAHVVQQSRAARVRLGADGARSEREAWGAADAVAAGGSPSIAGGQVVPSIQAADGISPLAPRPFAIEMEWTPGASSTSELGFRRDAEQFWKRYAQHYGDHISPENRARIGGKPFQAPRVDKTWIKYYPQDALYEGDVLEHHHAGQSSRAVGVPRRLHDAYTSMHPQKTVVAEPGGPPPKPLGPLPTQERTDKEIARHTKAGRIRTATGQPPQTPIVPSTSELMSLPERQRRPIDTTETLTIGDQIYPGKRAIQESRYPQAKYKPPPVTGKPKPNTALVPLTPTQEQDWSDVHPGTGPSQLDDLLSKAPKRGGTTIQLGKGVPTVPSSTSAPQHPKAQTAPAHATKALSSADALTKAPVASTEKSVSKAAETMAKAISGPPTEPRALQTIPGPPSKPGATSKFEIAPLPPDRTLARTGVPDMTPASTPPPPASGGKMAQVGRVLIGRGGDAVATMLNEMGINAMQQQEIEKAAHAVHKLQPEIDEASASGKWVIVVAVFDYRVNPLEHVFREPSDIKRFHRAYLLIGDTYQEARDGTKEEREATGPVLRAGRPGYPPWPAPLKKNRLYANALWKVVAPVPGTEKGAVKPARDLTGRWKRLGDPNDETMTIIKSQRTARVETWSKQGTWAVESVRWDPSQPVVEVFFGRQSGERVTRESRFEVLGEGSMVEDYVIRSDNGQVLKMGRNFWINDRAWRRGLLP